MGIYERKSQTQGEQHGNLFNDLSPKIAQHLFEQNVDTPKCVTTLSISITQQDANLEALGAIFRFGFIFRLFRKFSIFGFCRVCRVPI